MLRIDALKAAALGLALSLGAPTQEARAEGRCATIADGTIYNGVGEVIRPGFDEWGYNYRARLFFGHYCDAYRDAEWCQPYRDIHLAMHWNDAWLSTRDCDHDGTLDRHAGHDSYRGSGAWVTNLIQGSYPHDGKQCPYF